jgi:hypothetical protein
VAVGSQRRSARRSGRSAFWRTAAPEWRQLFSPSPGALCVCGRNVKWGRDARRNTRCAGRVPAG